MNYETFLLRARIKHDLTECLEKCRLDSEETILSCQKEYTYIFMILSFHREDQEEMMR